MYFTELQHAGMPTEQKGQALVSVVISETGVQSILHMQMVNVINHFVVIIDTDDRCQ